MRELCRSPLNIEENGIVRSQEASCNSKHYIDES